MAPQNKSEIRDTQSCIFIILFYFLPFIKNKKLKKIDWKTHTHTNKKQLVSLFFIFFSFLWHVQNPKNIQLGLEEFI